MKGSRKQKGTIARDVYRFWPLLCAGFAFLLYLNTLSHEYALDDHFLITGNPMVQEGIAGIPDLLTTDYWEGPLGENKVSKLYRPLSLVTFALEKSFFGFNPALSHFINVLLYALLATQVFKLTRRLIPHLPVILPFLITLLFVAHPLHTESIANLKGRAEIMAGVFIFLSLNRLLDYQVHRKAKSLITSLVLFFLALLSKEDATPFLAVVPLVLWYNSAGTFKSQVVPVLKTWSLYLIPVGLMLLLRSVYADDQPKPFGFIENPMVSVEGVTRVANAMHVSADYFWQLLFPINLLHDYSYHQLPLQDGFTWQGILAALLLLGALIAGIRLALQRRFAGFALLVLFISFSIPSNLLVTIGVMKAERLMFFPAWPAMILLVLGLNFIVLKLKQPSRVLMISGCLWLAFFSIKTIARNPAWKNNEALLEADIERSTENVKVLSNYAAILRNKAATAQPQERDRLLSESASYLWKGTRVAPEYNRPWIDLGYIYEMRGMIDSAIVMFAKAGEINPDDKNIPLRIANLRRMSNPRFAEGKALVDAGNFAAAVPIFDVLITEMPDDFEVWFYYGGVNFNTGSYRKAVEGWEKAKQLSPDDPRIDEPLGHAREAVKNAGG